MSSNIHRFTAGLDDFAEREVPEMVEKRHRALTLEALRGVVDMTPVRTGRARGGWQVEHHTPPTASPVRLDKIGSATIAAEAPKALSGEAFTITYVANNVVYIEELENGHSKQAPRGMAEVTVRRLEGRFGGA